MATNSITKAGTMTGIDGIRAVLQQLPKDMRTIILADAVRAGAKPLERGMKFLAPVRTGALRASISTVVRKYPRNANAVAVVGPVKGYYRAGKRLGKKDSALGADSPVKYAHLVEFGHVTVAPKSGTTRRKNTAVDIGHVAARPFIRPAIMTFANECGNMVHRELVKGFDRSVKRARRKYILK